MSPLIPAGERIKQAWALIQKARDLPAPTVMGKNDLTYVAEVKTLLRDARDLVKFISKTPTATPEMKMEVQRILLETERASHEILHIDLSPR